MAGVERAVSFNQSHHSIVDGAGKRPWHIPIHAVVHDEEINVGRSRALEWNDPGVDRCANLGDYATIAELQPVERARGIFERRSAGAFVTIRHKVGKFGHDFLVRVVLIPGYAGQQGTRSRAWFHWHEKLDTGAGELSLLRCGNCER